MIIVKPIKCVHIDTSIKPSIPKQKHSIAKTKIQNPKKKNKAKSVICMWLFPVRRFSDYSVVLAAQQQALALVDLVPLALA